jgi:oxalate decarboxylase/phosphoglucose isomerase-like protein (cupin superfamily)
MLALYAISGLPLTLNVELEELSYDREALQCVQSKQVPLLELAPALLNKSLRYPEVVYTHHFNMCRKDDVGQWPSKLVYDVMCIPSGLLGIEYVKTHIFHINPAFAQAACVVQVFQGTLSVLMQKNKQKNDPFDINTAVEQSLLVDVVAGQKLVIPAGYYYTFSNCSEVPVVFSRVIAQEHIVNYQTLRRENGLAYYLISKNAKREIVLNPRYREVSELREVSSADINRQYQFDAVAENPLYEDIKVNSVKFADILNA